MRLAWIITWLFIASLIITPAVYGWSLMDDPVVEQSMSPDSDSWGVAIFGGPLVGIALAVGIVALTRGLSAGITRLNMLIWRHDQLLRSVLWTIAWVVVTGAIAVSIISDYTHSPPRYEYQILPFYVLGVLWFAVVRALALSKASGPWASNGTA